MLTWNNVKIKSEEWSLQLIFQYKQIIGRKPPEKIRASMGFKPVTSTIPVQCSTNWAMKPHIGSKVNLLSSSLPMCGFKAHLVTWLRRSRVQIPLKPWFFQASSFQLLKLENLLRWSFFTLIYNRSSNIWIISYILHIISLLTGDMNSIN